MKFNFKTLANKKFLMTAKIYLFLVSWLLSFTHLRAQNNNTTPNTTAELQAAIELVLEETQTPAVGIAMISPDGSVWTTGIGKADIQNGIDASEHTMFRIGSVTKMFVSLAILRLQEQGLVSLKDTVKSLIPEIAFNNPYAETAPILVEHLLEHTTGWNDLHIREFAKSGKGMTLKETLDYHPQSRVSRWVPGTRMAYCNSGPAVAAYIVEKITGQVYEDYIQQHFFDPLGMTNATFFNSDTYQRLGAKLYADGEAQEYWHILTRPSGSINASPFEMLKFLRLFLDRGKVDTLQLISEASLNRMETPSSTVAAQAGLVYGYGLCNQSSEHKSFVYRGHLGGVANGLANFSYLPEYKAGYVFMTTSGSLEALERITELIRDFQTKDLPLPKMPISGQSAEIPDIEGYYVSINPRFDLFYFIERLAGVQWIDSENEKWFKQGIGSEKEEFLVRDERTFASATTGQVSMVLVSDPLVGEVLYAGEQVLKRTSPIIVYGLWALFGVWILLSVSSSVVGIIWGVLYWKGRISGKANIQTRLWSVIPGLMMIVLVVLIIFGMNDFFQAFGNPGFISISIFMITILFAMASVWGLIYAIKGYRGISNRVAYWYSAVLVTSHFLVTCYLFWYGIIGVMTWS